MKELFLITAILLGMMLSACAPAGGGSSTSAPSAPTTVTQPVTDPTQVEPDDAGVGDVTIAPVIAPAAPTTPVVTPPVTIPPVVVTPPVVTPPIVTPPAPGNLACYSNAGVFCTGGNLNSDLVQLDLAQMFTGHNASLQVIVTSVTNDNNATNFAVCAQPNGAGCHTHSTCVSVNIVNSGTHASYPYMLCGDIVNPNTKVLE